ncbi:MAG: PEGA domain-containing protein, partial [Calditrichaeota bacterium]
MPLTPEEEKRLREQIRRELEEREQRLKRSKEQIEEERRRKLEERIRQTIREEEEERFYTERGLVKYKNRYGEIEWITPEEADKRMGRKRSKRTSRRRKLRKRRKLLRWGLNLGAVGLALMLFLFLQRYNPRKGVPATGTIIVKTDVPGAQIFLNGTEKHRFTPDTLPNMGPGNYFISVYKEGYSAWPPMQKISLERNRTAVVEFSLKSAARFGWIEVEANLPDFRVYVDGLPYLPGGEKRLRVPAGYHVITAVRPGYLADPPFRRIVIREDQHLRLFFNFQKTDELGYLKVTSNRSAGYIYLDDRLTGFKPNGDAFPVKAGIYQVRVRENGYTSTPAEKILEVKPGKRYSLSFHMQPETLLDTLQVITSVPGAAITVDGQWMPFVTPMLELTVSDGGHFFNLIRDGQPYSEKDIYMELHELDDKRLIVDF